MSQGPLAGSAGPHVFVGSREQRLLDPDDATHLERSLRMRNGDPLTISDGQGSWARAVLGTDGTLAEVGQWQQTPDQPYETTVAFSLVKGAKPELVVQKLTELGVDKIVGLVAERSVVRWDEAKQVKAMQRWERIAREASMQSHRVRLPQIVAVVEAATFFSADSTVALAHFDGAAVTNKHRCIAIGPEGGWSDRELEAAQSRVSLGETVLRAETAAITAGALMVAARRTN